MAPDDDDIRGLVRTIPEKNTPARMMQITAIPIMMNITLLPRIFAGSTGGGPGLTGGTGVTDTGELSTAAPHSVQYLFPGIISAPHDEQNGILIRL
nr:hypothetical protein [uncultured Methanoregula sp.]